MINFEDFLIQEDCDKYNMLQECNSYIKSKDREIKWLENQLQQKENIIKEVRERFKYYGEKEDIVGYSMYNITGEMLLNLLDILDKVGDEK